MFPLHSQIAAAQIAATQQTKSYRMKAYKNRYLTGRMTALLSCLLLFSCDDERFLDDGVAAGQHSDNISFGISLPEDAVSRSAGADIRSERTTGQLVLRAEGAADTLCVRATVTDGIEGSPLTGKTVISRAAPQTEPLRCMPERN